MAARFSSSEDWKEVSACLVSGYIPTHTSSVSIAEMGDMSTTDPTSSRSSSGSLGVPPSSSFSPPDCPSCLNTTSAAEPEFLRIDASTKDDPCEERTGSHSCSVFKDSLQTTCSSEEEKQSVTSPESVVSRHSLLGKEDPSKVVNSVEAKSPVFVSQLSDEKAYSTASSFSSAVDPSVVAVGGCCDGSEFWTASAGSHDRQSFCLNPLPGVSPPSLEGEARTGRATTPTAAQTSTGDDGGVTEEGSVCVYTEEEVAVVVESRVDEQSVQAGDDDGGRAGLLSLFDAPGAGDVKAREPSRGVGVASLDSANTSGPGEPGRLARTRYLEGSLPCSPV